MFGIFLVAGLGVVLTGAALLRLEALERDWPVVDSEVTPRWGMDGGLSRRVVTVDRRRESRSAADGGVFPSRLGRSMGGTR